MPTRRKQTLEERRRLKSEYGELFASVSALLFREDPIGISFDVNSDEYHAETGTILPRLKNCASEDDALGVLYEEFVRWFGADQAGPQGNYRNIADEIWQLWHRRTPR